MPKTSPLAWLLFVSCIAVWGSSFILMRQGLIAFSAVQVALIRMASAGLLLTPLAVHYLRRSPALRQYPFSKAGFTALTGTVLPAFLFAFAQTHIPSSTAGILNSTTPVWVLIQGMLIFGIRPGRWQSLGVSIGLAGAVALVLLRPGGGFQADYEYAILPLIATMNYAFNANYVKLKLPWMNPLELTAVSIAMAGLLSVPPLFLLTDITQVVASHAYGWEALGYTLILGFVGTGITKGLFYKLVPLSDAVFATSISYLIPVVALFWGGLAGEPLGWLHLVALVAILLGIYLISKPVKTGPEATAANASAPALETDAARD